MELTIDFGGTDIKIGTVEDGTILRTSTLPISGTRADLDTAALAAQELLDQRDESPTAVGIALPGVVDRATGRLLHANAKYDYLRDDLTDLVAWGTSRFGVPVIVENDARAALAGEMTYGAARGETDVVMLILGTGIGSAAAQSGMLLRGRHDHAGILAGHVTVDLAGPLCPCGNIGCAEAIASTRAVRASRPDLGGIDDLLRLDAPADRALIDLLLRTWGATVTTLCHMYDPDLVVLSGGVLRAGTRIAAPIEDHVRRHLWPSSNCPRFVVPDEPETSVLRGLAALASAAMPAPHLQKESR